ncbi:MAG TPA: arginine deiminase family protein [Thermoanaerobaculia bacterium]|jgi:dimethylargininase|nr:arginine deiminase family protein [Thermoanaerobaculia bacterium]
MLIALTRAVPRSINRCELTHLNRNPIDVDIVRRQHQEYETALSEAGCRIERLPAADDLPDSVFVEDTAIVLDEVAVITRPGAESRRPETASVAAALRNYRDLVFLESPAILDGGDVLRIGRRVFVGQSTRTNAEGFRQLSAALNSFGYSVKAITPRGCLHLKSAVTAFSDDGVIINPEWVDASIFDGTRVITVDPSEPPAANVLRVGDVVLCATAFPRTAQRLRNVGVSVRLVDASELAKAEGALTCCSVIVAS